MLAVLIPSRGLIHSETLEAVQREVDDVEHEVFFTHSLPIPDCFNDLTERAVPNPKFTEFWFVEEDVVPPLGALKALKLVDSDIAFINYHLNKFSPTDKCYKVIDNTLVWTGLGCTLVKRRVFEGLKRPWFQTGYSLVAICEGSRSRNYRLELRLNPQIFYGGQDVFFGVNAHLSGFEINIVPDMLCGHYNDETYIKDQHQEQIPQ